VSKLPPIILAPHFVLSPILASCFLSLKTLLLLDAMISDLPCLKHKTLSPILAICLPLTVVVILSLAITYPP
jgi:hypothetical protein